ncbi:hypothetical protein EDD92_2335 [Streptomyces sp. TLI_185]|nr:hypothetical protein EDD92_1754 [Streptomyces sp. TLI_185]RPF32449.1 hypothetical protein EDD92_2335 [Streptomyces sp. TLI_185]
MLASTVQFSNNDQPPITPNQKLEFTGAGIEGVHSLRHPTACPALPPLVISVPRSEEQYWQPEMTESAE